MVVGGLGVGGGPLALGKLSYCLPRPRDLWAPSLGLWSRAAAAIPRALIRGSPCHSCLSLPPCSSTFLVAWLPVLVAVAAA